MQPKVVQGIIEYQHYNTTIDIYTYMADEKQEESGKFGKAMEVAELGEMDNSGMVQTLQ